MLVEKRLRVADVERDHVGRGQGDGVDVDGEARCGDQGRVAGTEQGQAHVAEALLGTDRGDDLLIGIEADAEPLLVSDGHLAPQVVDAVGHAVAMVARVARGLAELVDDPFLGRIGGVAHPQVDHVDPVPPLAVLQLVDPAEQVRGEVANAGGDLQVVSFDRLMLLRARVGLGIHHRQVRPGPAASTAVPVDRDPGRAARLFPGDVHVEWGTREAPCLGSHTSAS